MSPMITGAASGRGAARRRASSAVSPSRVVLVTGMSGAGRSSALKILEDLGYEAVDNLPLSLLGSIVAPRAASSHESGIGEARERKTGRAKSSRASKATQTQAAQTQAVPAPRPLAIGVDIRTRDFGVEAFLGELDRLMARHDLDVHLLFLDSSDDTLLRRYTETRRRHPLAGDRPVRDGIMHERRLLASLRDRADRLIDTSDFVPGDLKRILTGHYRLSRNGRLAVSVMSFSYGQGLPREADLVFDVRFLRNPHYVPALKPHTGLDPEVGAYVAADEGFPEFLAATTRLLGLLLPRFEQEGKSYLTVAVGCTGGRHRSVYVAERLAAWLRNRGLEVAVVHRDIPGGDTPGHAISGNSAAAPPQGRRRGRPSKTPARPTVRRSRVVA